ncbi:MAG: phosphatidate cytidylyltransferase [Candidatus Acidiferrum sp.]
MTWKRVATAALLIPFVVGIVLYGPTAIVAIATAAIIVLSLWEYFALGDAIGQRAYRFWTAFCAVLMLYFQWRESQGIHSARFPGTGFEAVTIGISVFVLGIAVLTLFSRRPLVETLPAAGISSSALLLVAYPLSFVVPMHGAFWQGSRFLLFALVLTWAADTTAYFVGRAVGRHPLAPRISPKKTWEGSIGSMFGSLLVAYLFHFWIDIALVHLMLMAVLGNVAGQTGDLLESAYKRSAGVKDSGGLLPGHGGVLDRIDALILCVPVIWYYLVLVNPSSR